MIRVRSPRTQPIALAAAGFVVCLLVATTLFAGTAAGQTSQGEPELDAYLPANEVAPGTESEFVVNVQNDASVRTGTATEAVTTARAVSVEITDEGPFDVRTGESPIGTIRDGAVSNAEFGVVVPEDVEPGTYEIDVRVRYSVTNRQTANDDQRLRRSAEETLEVRVTDDALFAIGNVSTDVQPGTTGEAEIELENVGSEPAYATTATITGGGGVTIDGERAEAFIGEFDPGDRRTVDVDVRVAESVVSGEKPIEAVFEYEDGSGIEQEPRTATGSLVPIDEQSITIDELDDTLSVGYDGRISGALRNDGPTAITDGVLIVEPASDSLVIEERRVALPELVAGETIDFVYPTEVSGQADPGPRQVRFTLEYANGGRTTTTVGPVSERVVVDDSRNEFTIDGSDASVTQGSTTELTLSITNDRPETLRNINAKLYTDSPLSTSSDEAFVDELEPGETDEIRFDLTAEGGAMAKTHRVELDFQYDTEGGETVLSRTYQHPVEIEERVDDGDDRPSTLVVAVGVVALIALLAGGGLWWRRRD
ncbi:MAG: COG1361 S-layer family protein [Halobacteriota archaeon]|uniref:COG1361 S-layer family protein n=1 Tax=Natronomonas sp. TaxID=2184060 RepID=UPI0039769A5A